MRKLSLLCLLLFVAGLYQAYACRIVPRRPETDVIAPSQPPLQAISVKSHSFTTTIKNGVATTVLESLFYNPNPQVLEGTYLFPLPRGASVSQFSMWIDGKEMSAELLDADKARNLYISIVQRMIDPGLLEFVGRETFKLRIYPIPAYGDKKIKLSYQQVLPMDGNLMRYVYPLTTVGNGPQDVLGSFSFDIKITSDIPLKSVFSPSHNTKIVKEENSASVSYAATNVQPEKDVVLYISRSMGKVDLSFIPFRKKGEDGYFLLMLAPKTKTEGKEANPKDVVFVLDTSGSMVGDKMKQAKAALKYCVQLLRPEDRFNLIPFATEASPYKDALLAAGSKEIEGAVKYIEEEIEARGGTNIEEALRFALEMAPKTGERPFMVVFITDGKPTIGVTQPEEILANVKKINAQNLRLFTFGVGEDLNTKLLDLLAEENHGVREYVATGEDIEIKVSSFFEKVSSPVLSNLRIQFPSSESLRTTEVYPREFPDLFKGATVTLLGRYTGTGDQAIRLTGLLSGKNQEFVFEVVFPEEKTENDMVPRLWAVRKVGFLLDQIRLHGEESELKKEVVMLAKKFGIVTPYTSYLVVEDNIQTQNIRRDVMRPQDRPQNVPAPPSAFAPNEERSGNAFDKEAAPRAMKAESGEKSVQASQEFKKMKEAEAVDEDDRGKDKGRAGKADMRKVADKTFYLQNGVWYDSEYHTVKIDKMAKVRIQYLSNDYFKLLKEEAEIGKFLAVGTKLVLIWKNKIFEIY
jgi:Ca-activated chloride channel family protein